MPANIIPNFVSNPRITSVEVVANSNRDGTGTTYQLFTPGASGSRIDRINCILAGTISAASTAMAVRVFLCDENGNNPRILRESLIPSSTPTNNSLGGNTSFVFLGGLLIGTNSTIRVGQSTGNTTNNRGHWTCEASDFGSNVPLIASSPLLNMVVGTLSSTRTTDGGTIYQIFTASTDIGSRIERLSCVCANNENTQNTASQIRLYVTEANGSNPRLLREGIITQTFATIPAPPNIASFGSWYQFIFNNGLLIGTQSELWVGQQIAGANNNLHWVLEGSNFVSNKGMIYPLTPNIKFVQTATASPRQDPTNLTLLYTSSVNGSRLEKITVESTNSPGQGAPTNKTVRIYIKWNNIFILYKEAGLNGLSTTITTYGACYTFYFNSGGLLLPASTEIWVGQTSYNAAIDTLNWIAEVYEY